MPAKRGRKRLYDPTSNWQHALLKGSGRTNTNTAQSDSESEVEAEDNTPLRDKRQVIYFEGKKIEVGVKGGFVGMEKDRPHLMSDEELMRIRITQKIKSLEGLEHTPSNLMEKELLDLMLTSSKFIQKQKKNPVGRPTNVTEYSEKDINSLMAFIPLDDGGVRMATVATNMQPKSLHKLCTEKCCGFCFDRFTEADHENITDVILGAMEYPLHEYCFMMFQQNKFIAQPSPNIVIEGVHMCATIDDVDCDLCGRTGGILVEFQLDKSITSVAPSDANHWVGHVPCLQFVASSKLFSPPVDSPENMESERAKARLIKIQPNETTSIEPRSLFDVLFQANRCALCGGEGGIVPRCIAANCCARAHPLCCMLTDKWLIADFSLKGQNTKARGLLCPAHKKHMK